MKILVGVKRVIDYAAKVMPSPPLRFTPEFLFLLELCACFCAFCCPHPLGAEHLSFKVVTRKILSHVTCRCGFQQTKVAWS